MIFSGFQTVCVGLSGAIAAVTLVGFGLSLGKPAASEDWLAQYDRQEIRQQFEELRPVLTSIGNLIKHYAHDAGRKVQQAKLQSPLPDVLDERCRENELSWLACAVYFEARNQSIKGQFKVALSIRTRVWDPRWPNTVKGVVREGELKRNKCQYSFMCDGLPNHVRDENAWTTALFVAQKAINSSETTCAHSYHAVSLAEKKSKLAEEARGWFKTLRRYERVGDHIFYCDGGKTLARNKGVVAPKS